MKKIETEILIESSITSVWNVLMDFDSYQYWNPFIKSIVGKAKRGETLNVTIQTEKKKQMNFKPKVLRAEYCQEFRWKGNLFVNGLFDGEHYFVLEKKAGSLTRLFHGEIFSGLMLTPVFKMISKDTELGFTKMNQALKERCEERVEEVVYDF